MSKEKARLRGESFSNSRKSTAAFCLIDKAFDSPAMQRFLDDPDATYPGVQDALKNGNTCTVWGTEVSGNQLIVKRYNVKNLFHGLKLSLRQGRAFSSWENAHLLTRYGIRTPRPVALVKIRRSLIKPIAYFITQREYGTSALEWFAGDTIPHADKQRMAHKTVGLFRQLKSQQIVHGDMKATNILIVDGEPLLIDLDAMKQYRNQALFDQQFKQDWSRFMRNWIETPNIYALFEEADKLTAH